MVSGSVTVLGRLRRKDLRKFDYLQAKIDELVRVLK